MSEVKAYEISSLERDNLTARSLKFRLVSLDGDMSIQDHKAYEVNSRGASYNTGCARSTYLTRRSSSCVTRTASLKTRNTHSGFAFIQGHSNGIVDKTQAASVPVKAVGVFKQHWQRNISCGAIEGQTWDFMSKRSALLLFGVGFAYSVLLGVLYCL